MDENYAAKLYSSSLRQGAVVFETHLPMVKMTVDGERRVKNNDHNELETRVTNKT